MTTLVDRFLRSKVGQDFQNQEAAALLARRKELVAEIKHLTAEHEASLPALIESEEKAVARLEKAREALKPLEAAVREAALARIRASNSVDSARGPLEGELRASASPLIDGFVEEMRTLVESVRRESPSSPPLRPGVFGGVDPNDVKAVDERNQAHAARLARIRQARDTAPTLKLLALTPAELDAQLADLRATTTAKGK